MFSIRNILIAGIIGLQLVTAGAIILSSYLTTDKVLVGHARSLMSHVSVQTAQHAERYLALARQTADLTQELANYAVIRNEDHVGMEIYFLKQLQLHPSFAGIYYGASDGSFTYVKRDSGRVVNGYLTKFIRTGDGVRTVERVWRDPDFVELARDTDPEDAFDPRTRPWFKNALETQGPVWTEPYIFFTSRKPGITSANPVHNMGGANIGAVGVDMEIDGLSDFLASLEISDNARALILNHNGDVIAYSETGTINGASRDKADQPTFHRIDEFGDAVAQLAYQSLGRPSGSYLIDQALFTDFVMDGKTYLASFLPILHPELPWSLGIYLPKEDFLGVFTAKRRQNIYIAAAITLVACLLGILLWRGIAGPLSKLRTHARVVSDGNFEPPPPIGGAYDEIRELEQSFDRMVAGLRERDRRNAELAESLHESEAQLRQAQKMEAMGQLTGGLAHDFNNLLAVVIGNLDILREKLETRPDDRAVADSAIHAALRGADLTQRLLAFARRQRLKPATVDLNALVDNMTGLMQRTLGETINVQTDTQADLWTTKADPTQMETTLLNLAMNARHAMQKKGGTLTVETRNVVLERRVEGLLEDVRPGEYVMVVVRDTGIGMSSETLMHVFEPFYTTKAVGEGSGLGLSMVYGFMGQSQGYVSIRSAEGAGTEVCLYFPATQEAAPVDTLEDVPVEKLRGAGETVLVVEDDPEVKTVAVTMISNLGYRVLDAMSGPAALAVLDRNDEIDVLFTDMVLPDGMNGSELAAAVLSRRPEIKVLFTTGYSDPAMAMADPSATADIIAKPYRRQELAQRLHALLHEDN